jgi:hypothetical protein
MLLALSTDSVSKRSAGPATRRTAAETEETGLRRLLQQSTRLHVPQDRSRTALADDIHALLTADNATLKQRLGPVGLRFGQVRSGLLHLNEARARVADDVRELGLRRADAHRLAEVAVRMTRFARVDDAYSLAVLLLSAAEAAQSAASWTEAACAYVQCATFRLRDFPDVPLFRAVLPVAEGLVELERVVYLDQLHGGDASRLSRALSCSAQLRLVAVAGAGNRSPGYWEDDGDWHVVVSQHLPSRSPGADVEAFEAYRLRDPVGQMQRACEELSEAVDLRTGEARGGSLVMLARALDWLVLAGVESPKPVVAAATEALGLLDPAGEKAQLVQQARVLLSAHGVVTGEVDPLGEPLDVIAERIGWPDVARSALAALEMRRDNGDVTGARHLLLRFLSEMPWDVVPKPDRVRWLAMAVHLLDGGVVACEDSVDVLTTAEAAEETFAADKSVGESGGSVGAQRVAVFTHLAWHTSSTADAIAILDRVHEEARGTDFPWVTAHAFTRGYCWLREVSASTDNPVKTADAAGRAMRQALELNIGEMLAISLGALANLPLRSKDKGTTVAVLQALWGFTPALDCHPDDNVRRLLHAIALATAPACRGTDEDGPGLLLVHRWMFKAPMFGVLVRHPTPVAVDEQGWALLDQARSYDTPDAHHEGQADDPVREELLMLAYVGERERLRGRTPAELLANARRTFDAHMAELASGQEVHRDAFLPFAAGEDSPFAAVAEAVQGRTVLLDLWMGTNEELQAAAYSATFARGESDGLEVHFGACSWALALDSVLVDDPEIPGFLLVANPAAPLLAELRVALQAQPDLRPVSREAQRQLEGWGYRLLASAGEELRELSMRGYDHLCVTPSGPLCLSPIHLFMTEPGHTLADDWTVTILPTPSLLTPRQTSPPGQGLLVASSPAGGVQFGFPEEPAVEDQARRVAEVAGGTLLSPDQARPAEVLRLAESARYLHLVAHGSDYPAAPAFQCLYLTPDQEGDGRLFAYEVVQHDLSGVDLVTLSACESALGRVDASDNPRGLIAAFLQAGAHAVVAALWPVTPAVSMTFFTALYSARAKGSDVLTSYRIAQLETRQRHSGYRDWGAFIFTGDWRERKG